MMEHEQLKGLHGSMKTHFKDYISMIAVGSIATGDPYVPGRSDKDILLTFWKDPLPYSKGIEQILTSLSFDESYNFTPIIRDDFGRSDSQYTFSNRFRSKTLFGLDLVQFSFLPDSEAIKTTYTKGLKEVIHRTSNCVLNSNHWSEKKIRDEMWKQLKHAFMYLAIKEYHETREYPVTRMSLVDKLKSNEVSEAFYVLHSIDEQPKKRIIGCARGMIEYIRQKTEHK